MTELTISGRDSSCLSESCASAILLLGWLMLFSMRGKETAHMDQQTVLSAVEQLLTLHGWVAALCPTLSRPFGQNENAYDDLVRSDHLYFIGIAIHSADHFLVDQLAVIVQIARRIGTQKIFVSMLDYDSSDSTETLLDLCEAVLTLLGVPFRIRRVPGMTAEENAAYYPLEESYMRNLVLEPLYELNTIRKIKFHRVIWLKGFTCPNDILETITVSQANDAAMVCGMDWAESNGFFIFSDRCVIHLLYFALTDLDQDGARVTSKATSSASPSPRPTRTPDRHARRSAPRATHSIYPSRSSAASPAHTSSTPRSRTTSACATATAMTL